MNEKNQKTNNNNNIKQISYFFILNNLAEYRKILSFIFRQLILTNF